MGTLLDFGAAARSRSHRQRAAWGLVTELVGDGPAPRPRRGRKGVVHVGGVATVCVVEAVPAVGDVIRGDVPAVVEQVRITREGRVIVHARPLDAA